MSDKFRPIDRATPYLLPPSLQDWLPEKHLARFVVDLVERLDLREIERCYGGGGKQPYHPAMLLSLLFYGYATGVFSSRKLEKATYDSVAFRFITADCHPDHDTIAAFRKRFLKELEALFVQLLMVADTVGMLKLGTVSLDGTKIKANASKHKALSWGYAVKLEEQLRQEVRQLLRQAEEADAVSEPELDIPAELARREDRLAAIEKAKAEIERRAHARFEAEQAAHEEKLARRAAKEAATGRKARGPAPRPPVEGPRETDQVNLTDAESRIMPSSEGFVQAYNAQAAVDAESYLIVENHITQQPNDKQELIPTVERLAGLGLGSAEALLADAGYFSRRNVEYCATEQITPYISAHRVRHNRPLAQRRPPPADADVEASDAGAADAGAADAVMAMARRLASAEGRALYARRKATVEPVFGIIKHVLGFRRFHLRGLAAVQGEWNLVCMAWNLKRMHALAR